MTRIKTVNIAVICTMIAAFIIHEYLRVAFPEAVPIRSIIKGGLSLIPVCILLLGMRTISKPRQAYVKPIFLGLVVCLIGDVVINYSDMAGMVIFMVAQGILIYSLLRETGIKRHRFLMWAGLSILVDTICLLSPNIAKLGTVFCICGCIYIALMLLMVVSALGCKRPFFMGALFFGISDLLLVRNTLLGEGIVSHALSLGTYYIGITVLGIYAFLYAREGKSLAREQ